MTRQFEDYTCPACGKTERLLRSHLRKSCPDCSRERIKRQTIRRALDDELGRVPPEQLTEYICPECGKTVMVRKRGLGVRKACPDCAAK